jgi:penicillin-binding protein 2
VVQREYYHTLAEANRISVCPVVPNRGSSSTATASARRQLFGLHARDHAEQVANVERAIDELAA